MEKCYCGLKKNKRACCSPFLLGTKKAATAEELMRSRYSAYVTGNIDYILSTHHPLTRPLKEKAEILKWTLSVKWLGLTVHSTNQGGLKDTIGYVNFTALFMEQGKLDRIEENSKFIKEDNFWFYTTH